MFLFHTTNIIYSAFSLAHQLRLLTVLLPLRRDLRAWSSTGLRAPISGHPLHLCHRMVKTMETQRFFMGKSSHGETRHRYRYLLM